MYKIAIIEDMSSDAKKLKLFVQEYIKALGVNFTFKHFSNALDFFDSDMHVDIIFLDMEMPLMNGVEAAKRIREKDKDVVIIFYSGAQQYAINGYEVGALDFLLKPITVFDVFGKLDRAISALQKINKEYITLHDEERNVAKINIYDIQYVEKEKNQLIFFVGDKIYKERRNLYEIEELFLKCGFAKCRSGVMVNLRYIEKYSRESVFVGGKEFWVSRGAHDAFFARLMNYFK